MSFPYLTYDVTNTIYMSEFYKDLTMLSYRDQIKNLVKLQRPRECFNLKEINIEDILIIVFDSKNLYITTRK